ncbi:MAG: glycosyltransferase family 4 protein [Bacteroidales bacterium]|nr:glycosyltransferase family 4 protein [Bacteroidales bacterium]
MPKVIINGDFFCNNLTGIERFAFEITKRIDLLSEKNEIGIVIPQNAKTTPYFENLLIIPYKNDIISFPKWQQFIFPGILKKYNAIPLDYGNCCSLLHPGITFLHDIYCEEYPNDFKTPREKYECLYFRIMYRIIALCAKKIITVSNFSKNQIVKKFKINENKIKVIYSSWDHFKTIEPDYSVFDDFPPLSKPYFFSLGSLSKRKNIKWIVEYALNNPNVLFAISGTYFPGVQVDELKNNKLSNIILLGYLEDSKVKALMENCKAFLLPSYYEGFGLTPLEALSCGAQIVISNTSSLPEIYGNTAHYIDPFNTDIDLNGLLTEPVENPEKILKKYSYEHSARQLYELIKEYV